MPLLPPHLRPYLPDAPASQAVAAPSAMAGLGYDAATRSYVDQMGRMGQARDQFWGPLRRLQAGGRVADRFLLGPGNNMTPSLQAARAARSRLFRTRLGLMLGAGTLAAGALGGAAVGLPGMVISGAGSAASSTAGALTSPNGMLMRSDPLNLFGDHKINFEGNWAQQSWRNRAESLFRPRGYQGPDRALQTRVEHQSVADPDGTLRAEMERTREARQHNRAVDMANAEAARTNAAAARVNQMTQGLGLSTPTAPIVPMQPRMQIPAAQTGTAEIRPEGYQGRGRALQTDEQDMNIQYPTGYRSPGMAYQTDEQDMNIQYPTGYRGPGRAYQTGTTPMRGGWLGNLSRAAEGGDSFSTGRQTIS